MYRKKLLLLGSKGLTRDYLPYIFGVWDLKQYLKSSARFYSKAYVQWSRVFQFIILLLILFERKLDIDKIKYEWIQMSWFKDMHIYFNVIIIQKQMSLLQMNVTNDSQENQTWTWLNQWLLRWSALFSHSLGYWFWREPMRQSHRHPSFRSTTALTMALQMCLPARGYLEQLAWTILLLSQSNLVLCAWRHCNSRSSALASQSGTHSWHSCHIREAEVQEEP